MSTALPIPLSRSWQSCELSNFWAVICNNAFQIDHEFGSSTVRDVVGNKGLQLGSSSLQWNLQPPERGFRFVELVQPLRSEWAEPQVSFPEQRLLVQEYCLE